MNKKIFVFLILLLVVSFSTQAFASLTFTTNTITGTTDSTIDLGAGNDLNLQTTGSNITIGTDTTLGSKLSIDASGSNTTPLIIKTNGSVGNYTPANSGIFIKDAAGTEILRIFASDPEIITNYNAANLYIGRQAGFSQPTDNTSAGFWNIGIGTQALYSNITGSNNVANGVVALYSNTTGSGNTANGSQTLYSNTIGSTNTANGTSVLYSNITGSGNTGNGKYVLFYNTTGSNNTAFGSYSLYRNTVGSNNVALGNYAGAYELGSNAFYVDNQNRTNTAGDKTKAILYGVMAAAPANQKLTINAKINANQIPAYANNAAALAGGLVAGDLYYTDTAGEYIVKVTHNPTP